MFTRHLPGRTVLGDEVDVLKVKKFQAGYQFVLFFSGEVNSIPS
jgi:hypothetical protein